MKRLLSGTLLVVALVLTVALAVLWVRSHFTWDSVFFETRRRPHMFESSRGRLGWSQPRDSWGEQGPNWGSYRFTEFPRTVLDDATRGDPSARAWGGFIVSSAGTAFSRKAYAAPYWFLILLSGIPAAILLRAGQRRRQRVARGQCARCGYDLRATPQRCPECGTEPPARSSKVKNGPASQTARREGVSSGSS